MIEREYDFAGIRLRRLFNIPQDEIIMSIDYDRGNSKLIIVTLKDYDKKVDL